MKPMITEALATYVLFTSCAWLARGTLLVNEVASSSAGGACGGKDWVELFNNASQGVALAGYHLCDDKGCSHPNAFAFPSGSQIGSNSYLVVCKNTTSSAGFNFGIGADDKVDLVDPGGKIVSSSGTLLGRAAGYTWSRFADGKFKYVQTATPGFPNDQTPAPFVCSRSMPCWDLFDQEQFRTYDIQISEANIAKMDEKVTAEVYVPCIVTINAQNLSEAETYPYAGCRFKGSVGAWAGCQFPAPVRGLLKNSNPMCRKLNLKFDANMFNKSSSDSFHGLKKLQMHSMISDNSLMFERVAYNLMQRSNFFAPRAMHAKLSINGVSDGVRLLVEQVDDIFVRERMKNKQAAKSTLYKELWTCQDKPKPQTCPGGKGIGDARCTCLGNCQGKSCHFRTCENNLCYKGNVGAAACAGKAQGADGGDGGICYEGNWIQQCAASDELVDCVLPKRREGTGHHKPLIDALRGNATACVDSGAACTRDRADKILSMFMNKSSVVDALVGTLMDQDQFTTLYGDASGGHNFYTLASNDSAGDRLTIIPWDFDRGFALCNAVDCTGGGGLGDVRFSSKAPMPVGGIQMQRELAIWGRCYMPPWFTDVTSHAKLKQDYCVTGVQTFAQHVHASCDPVLNLMARAWKTEYAERMTQFLNGALSWATQHIQKWRAQIRAAVEEDGKKGGFPSLYDWEGTLNGVNQRVHDLLKNGQRLACGAASAATQAGMPPTSDALKCFGPVETKKSVVPGAGGRRASSTCSDGHPICTADLTQAYSPSFPGTATACAADPTAVNFNGSISVTTVGSVTKAQMEIAIKATVITYYDVPFSSVTNVVATLSRRLAEGTRRLAGDWHVAFKISTPAGKAGSIVTRTSWLAESSDIFKASLGTSLTAAGASHTSLSVSSAKAVTTWTGPPGTPGSSASATTEGSSSPIAAMCLSILVGFWLTN